MGRWGIEVTGQSCGLGGRSRAMRARGGKRRFGAGAHAMRDAGGAHLRGHLLLLRLHVAELARDSIALGVQLLPLASCGRDGGRDGGGQATSPVVVAGGDSDHWRNRVSGRKTRGDGRRDVDRSAATIGIARGHRAEGACTHPSPPEPPRGPPGPPWPHS